MSDIKKPLVIIGGQLQELPAGSAVLLDSEGSPVRIVDDTMYDMLRDILKELRVMNFHLTSMTGERFVSGEE